MHSISAREAERRAEQSRQSIAARLGVAASAAYCGVSASYLNKLRCIGNGPIFIKRGRRIIYDTSDLDAWLDSGRRTSTSDRGEAAGPIGKSATYSPMNPERASAPGDRDHNLHLRD